MSFIRNSDVGRFSDLTAKSARPRKVCARCGNPIPRMKKLYCSPCSDIVMDERNAKARAKHAEARKVYVERNRKGPL